MSESWDYVLVDSLAQSRREISGKAMGVLKDLGEAAARREGFCGEKQPEVGKVTVGEESRLALDECFSSSPSADPGVECRGIETQPVALHDEYPWQVLVVGLGECVADRGDVVEPRRSRFGQLVLAQHDGECSPPSSTEQDESQIVQTFDAVAERLYEVAVPAAYGSRRFLRSIAPVPARSGSVLKLVKRYEPLVVDAR